MCTISDVEKTKKFKKENKGKIITVYKLLDIVDGEYKTPFTKTNVKKNHWLKPTLLGILYRKIIHLFQIGDAKIYGYGAIHVHMTKESAEVQKHYSCKAQDSVIVPCKAYTKDLLGLEDFYTSKEAAFKKIWVGS